MNTLYIYNPENDIALAYDASVRFTPPRQAAMLARYGALLMSWIASDGDYVYVPEPLDEEYASSLRRWQVDVPDRFGLKSKIVHAFPTDALPEPWGWSVHIARTLVKGGVSLPRQIASHLEEMRNLSHRRISIEINCRLRQSLRLSWGDSVCAEGAEEIDDTEAMDSVLSCRGGDVFVKSPWSSSGRGVVDGRTLSSERLRERCRAIVAAQGSVLIEPAYDKVADFAMLFRSDGCGNVSFVGLSMFTTERGASYSGNIIDSDDAIFARLKDYVPAALLCDIRNELIAILSDLAGNAYRGYLGVDMMIVNVSDGKFAVVPCVELNLRCTMGVIAHEVYRHFNSTGMMRVVPGKRTAAEPLGALPLVPVNDCFNIFFTPY